MFLLSIAALRLCYKGGYSGTKFARRMCWQGLWTYTRAAFFRCPPAWRLLGAILNFAFGKPRHAPGLLCGGVSDGFRPCGGPGRLHDVDAVSLVTLLNVIHELTGIGWGNVIIAHRSRAILRAWPSFRYARGVSPSGTIAWAGLMCLDWFPGLLRWPSKHSHSQSAFGTTPRQHWITLARSCGNLDLQNVFMPVYAVLQSCGECSRTGSRQRIYHGSPWIQTLCGGRKWRWPVCCCDCGVLCFREDRGIS